MPTLVGDGDLWMTRVSPTGLNPRQESADVPRLVGSHDRATRDTGWEPLIPLSDTLAAVLEDWRTRIGEVSLPRA